MMERQVTLQVRVRTNVDDATLRRRVVDFFDPEELASSLVESHERLEFVETEVQVADVPEVQELPRAEASRTKVHEWAEHNFSERTVCGIVPSLKRRDFRATTNLGKYSQEQRCKNCERMRSAIGMSRALEALS
jgi:hypothetical protein